MRIMVTLVIGPSGVGKSDYGRHAMEAIPKCQFLDLDRLVREKSGTPVSQLLPQIGEDAFHALCRQAVGEIMESCTADITIVAVGAGALESPHATDWISGHQGPTVALVADPDEVYRRGRERNRDRPFEAFFKTEHS